MAKIRNYFIAALLLVIAAGAITSCMSDDDTWKDYKEWREANVAWLTQQSTLQDASGKPFYTTVQAPWDNNARVLMHWFNDTTLTAGNLKPMYTSTVDVKYHLRLYNGTAVDSSYTRTTPADSLFRTTLGNNSVIDGWALALTRMHVGDSCRVIVPYQLGYGKATVGSILPYSTLQFDIKLVNIHKYYNY